MTTIAKTLKITDIDLLEPIVSNILQRICENAKLGEWEIFDLDATGSSGNVLTHKLNVEGILLLTFEQVRKLFSESGQVIEFDGQYPRENPLLRIVVRDGISVDILVRENFIDLDFLKFGNSLDPEFYDW